MLNLHDERRRLKQGDRSRLRMSCVPLVSTGAPEPASLQSTSCGTLRRDPNDPRAAMRRVTSWLLFLLALAALALGVAEWVGFLHLAAPPLAFGVAAAVFAALLGIRSLPLGVRRPIVFLVTLALLVALTGGLAYFQFVIKP